MKAFHNVWLFLLAVTGVEVFLAYVKASSGVMLAALLGLSVLKAIAIVAWFMHLKFERRLLRWVLFSPLIIMILTLLALLPDAARAQCAMCKRTAEAQNAERQTALNRGIVLMAVPPMFVLAGILLRARKR